MQEKMKPSVLILSDFPADSTLTLKMYIEALADSYEITVACRKPEEARRLGWRARFISMHLWSPKDLLRPFYHAALRFLRIEKTLYVDVKSTEIKYRRPRTTDVPWDYSYLLAYLLRQCRLFLRHVFAVRPDIIIAFNATELLEARALSIIHRAPYIYVVWEVWPNQHVYYSAMRSRTMALIERIGVHGASGIVVDDKIWRRFLELRYKVPHVCFGLLSTCDDALPHTERPAPCAPMKFYYHGMFKPGCGQDELVRAMKYVEGAHLYIRGLGAYGERLREVAAQEAVDDRVTFLSPLPARDLSKSGLEYDVGIIVGGMNSVNARMLVTFKLFHYVTSGLALVTLKSRPLHNFLKMHDVGMHYEKPIAREIAHAIQSCVDNPESVHTWKREAQRLAEEVYNASEQKRRLLHFVQSCIDAHVKYLYIRQHK